jgi:hypothetical protein
LQSDCDKNKKSVHTTLQLWGKHKDSEVKFPALLQICLHFNYLLTLHLLQELGSSGSIVSDYGLDDRVIEV